MLDRSQLANCMTEEQYTEYENVYNRHKAFTLLLIEGFGHIGGDPARGLVMDQRPWREKAAKMVGVLIA